MTDLNEIPLFSYGTLQQENVQLATFGRRLEGRPDRLAGFALSPMAITDPHVIATSGSAVHVIARSSGDPADRIPGIVFGVTPAEIEAADRYEAGPIARIRVRLESGAEAFVYVAEDSLQLFPCMAGEGDRPTKKALQRIAGAPLCRVGCPTPSRCRRFEAPSGCGRRSGRCCGRPNGNRRRCRP